jgi:hypothetical protein
MRASKNKLGNEWHISGASFESDGPVRSELRRWLKAGGEECQLRMSRNQLRKYATDQRS